MNDVFEPVPPLVPGELFIGGAGLARGYRGRPGVTAERFVPDPFGPERGARLYRTGDLVRTLPDGDLVFLGRIDHQVKLRGYRIELGEIESLLRGVQGVGQAVVVVREDQPGMPQLVAYVESTETRGEEVLRSYLADRLPAYMMPLHFVEMAALPVTVNGKLDRAALPAPDRGADEAAYVAPRTETERIIAEVWSEVLEVGRVGADDNFFDLGGHSLIATQVIARIHKNLNVMLPLHYILEQPTVAGQAELVEAALQAEPVGEDAVFDEEVFRI